jgi:N-acetylmuramoyl-L-alanine amidase
MRHDTVNQVSRIFLIILLATLAGIAWIIAQAFGLGLPDERGLQPQGVVGSAWNQQIAIISGHAGNDSGAVCEDDTGKLVVSEADINAEVSRLAAERLRRAGADVLILDEYDERLQGLRAEVLVSLHADSCIDASGYKAAIHTYTAIPETNQRLLDCIDSAYTAATGLAHHPNTVTHNMTEYHAFRRIDPLTPAAIIEMGFLGGDQVLLVNQPEVAAKGVADGILCFLESVKESE